MRTKKDAMRSPVRYHNLLKSLRSNNSSGAAESSSLGSSGAIDKGKEKEMPEDKLEEEENAGDCDGDEDYRDAGLDIVPVEENAGEFLVSQFGNIAARESRDDDSEDSDREDEVWRDDYVPVTVIQPVRKRVTRTLMVMKQMTRIM